MTDSSNSPADPIDKRLEELIAQDYAECVEAIRHALTETARPLAEFTAEFELKHGIKR